MADLHPLAAWDGLPGRLTVWRPSSAALDAVARAPVSLVPPSYEQEQHLRAYRACRARGEEMARVLVFAWDAPGTCDMRAMGHVVEAHLRRHDAYHGWFADGDERIVRHVLPDPSAIRIEPVVLGETGPDGWRRIAAELPGPFAWDCFRFGVVQRASGFTFFASIDHVVIDSTVVVTLVEEIHRRYRAIADGEAPPRLDPAGSYLDHVRAQRAEMAHATLETPGVQRWIEVLRRHGGRMPAFPLPLGALEDRVPTAMTNAVLLDPDDADRFAAACRTAGARTLGGLFAAAALAERSLAGTTRYGVVTPTTTRRPGDGARTVGWCMGIVPIDLETDGQGFAALARTAQSVFDDRIQLAAIPIERVLELAVALPDIRPAATGGVMLSYMDIGLPPYNARSAAEWEALAGRVYLSPGMAAQVGLWVVRGRRGLTLTAAFPDTAIARASMEQYIAALRDACRSVARG
ncbi:MAG: condensation domain-containing protein [Chloroflexota bacterium]